MKILLATDGSIHSTQAAKFVSELGRNNEIDVTALTISYCPSEESLQPWIPEWTQEEVKQRGVILNEARELMVGNCQSVTLEHRFGPTVPSILKMATETEADLIVVGAKGHSAIRRVLLGSISDSIATHANCSVLVVRSPTTPENEHQNIVVGFDKSVASRESVAELMELKWQPDTKVNLVSVIVQPYVFLGEGYAGPPVTVEPERIDAVHRMVERMASTIASSIPNTNTQTPTSDHVGSAIVDVIEESHANLVVVGDTGHSMLGELLLGSTTKYVLRHAPCSVWISRHHYKTDETKTQEEAATA